MKKYRLNSFFNKINKPLYWSNYNDFLVGDIYIFTDDEYLYAIAWPGDFCLEEIKKNHKKVQSHPLMKEVSTQLLEYSKGKRKSFDVPYLFIGTEFQTQVWQSLEKINYAKTMSYLDQSIALGDRKKVRAVAQANGKNPLSIIVPCHRIINSNGALGGYAGGLKIKEQLLKLEGKKPIN